ncbi:MAG TPA: pyridoxamine 5'-phosphate oxidase family protein [Solirubrobacterales bacterium]|nr:pyridoxamine 5'-phosphate oxidase family protein [Solirubrobacterales bacterium]
MAGATLEELPAWTRAMLDRERVGHLGLLDSRGRPRVLPVIYALWDGAAWTIVDNKPKRQGTEPARLRWLRARPQATLTVDHYDDDWSSLAWVQLVGEVAILEARSEQGALGALVHRYPQYEADPPPGPLLRLSVDRAVWWRAA